MSSSIVWAEVSFLRRRGARLHQHEWPPAVTVWLDISQLHGPNNPFRQHTRMANLWEAWGTGSQRGKGTMYDPVIMMTAGDGFLMRGIELESAEKRLIEYQQVWLVRPTQQFAEPLPPFQAELPSVSERA